MRSSKLWKKSKKIIGLVVLAAILYIAGNIISICTYSTRDEKCEADVAIILGAATYNGEVSPVYRERLNHGVALYQQGFVAKIIVTGGLGEGNTESDAFIAKKHLISQGIPEANILTEDKSTITQENLEKCGNCGV